MSRKHPGTDTAPPVLLQTQALCKHFVGRRDGKRILLRAVNEVSIRVAPAEVIGLVGESGSGKSTFARTAIRLYTPDSGQVSFDGQDITRLGQRALRPLRRQMQMVFQDPYSSLNPRMRVGKIVAEPLEIFKVGTAEERKQSVDGLLERVGLHPDDASKFPHEFSGGQRQRIGIARAVALRPRLIFADEPVSALDVSVQAQVLNLLGELQAEHRLAMVLTAHDLHVVRLFAQRVYVMYFGHVVEEGPTAEVLSKPLHPYTQALVNARPSVDRPKPTAPGVTGEIPSLLAPPPGCPFAARCPRRKPECEKAFPARVELRDRAHTCLFPLR